LFLPALVAAVYMPGTQREFLNWDDWDYVLDNPLLRDVDGLRRIWTTTESPQYYPLTFTTYWLEYQLWGNGPRGAYAVSVAIHALSAVLLFHLLRRLSGRARVGWIGAVLFAVHPLQVASVAWISERKTVLAACFYLLAFLLYLRYRDHGGFWRYLLVLLAFAAAVFSKTVVITLAASLVLADCWLLHRRLWGSMLRAAPLAVMALLPILVTAQRERVWTDTAVNAAERPLAAAAALWFYIGKFLAPVRLMAIYPSWDVSIAALRWWLPLLGLLIAVVLAVKLRGRLDRLFLFALAHFGVTILPALGLLHFGFLGHAPVADHLVYIALSGLALAAATALDRLLGSGAGGVRQPAMYVVMGILALVLGWQTWRQAQYWRGTPTLWTHTLKYHPHCAVAYVNLGSYQARRGEFALAAETLRRGVQYVADDKKLRGNLAAALLDLGRPAEALQHARVAVQLDPNDALARVRLGDALVGVGNAPEAAREYRSALELDPRSAEARGRLGRALAVLGAHHEALEQYQQAIELNPREARVHVLWGDSLAALGEVPGAIRRYEAALEIEPNNAAARNNLGIVLVNAGRFADGLVHLTRAAELAPENGNTQYMLAVALRRLGRVSEALHAARNAVALLPSDVEARRLLAELLVAEGQPAEAVRQLRVALQADPQAARVATNLAWLLAVVPDVRQPNEAVQASEHARTLTAGNNPMVLDALAAAYASAGRYSEAVTAAERAVDLARGAGLAGLADQIAARLALYRANQPYSGPVPPDVP
jgi:Flp pilus assembly protein TadD